MLGGYPRPTCSVRKNLCNVLIDLQLAKLATDFSD